MMLSYAHIKLLKRIKKNKVTRSQNDNNDLDYLFENGYIQITTYDNPDDFFAKPYLTEKGKAKLYEKKKQFIEMWIPIAISNAIALAALIISIIAISK